MGDRAARRWLIGALGFTLILGVFGLMARMQMLAWGLVRPGPVNVYFRLYSLHERPFLLLAIAFSFIAMLACTRARVHAQVEALIERAGPPSNRAVLAIALGVLAVAMATWFGVHHATFLAMDEFTSDFQARILAHGNLKAEVPPEWQPYIPALTPVFTSFEGLDGYWVSQYLPGYALLKTPFILVGLGALLNPLLTAISVVLIGAIARRLWPGEGLRPWLAIAFFVTSSELLMTSGTGYSMPAHLTLNLLWLWLYQRGDGRSWGMALAVGVLALGLHNPIPHALFVAPFLLRLLRERRWVRLTSAAVVYAVGGAVWMAWLRMANPFARPDGAGLLTMFALPDAIGVWLQMTNLSLLLTWHAPLFGALVLLGALRVRELEPPLADIALGVLFTLGFYFFFPLTQGHGWGYRYAYQVVGSLALLAAAGAPTLIAAIGAQRAQLLLASSFAIALSMQVPLRFLQGERFVRPYAAAYGYLRSRPAEVVITHGDSIWYSRDLIRNDPYLKGQPVVVAARMLTPAERAAIDAAHPGRVVDVRDGELLRLGLTLWVHRGW